jgi:hypothetical protein
MQRRCYARETLLDGESFKGSNSLPGQCKVALSHTYGAKSYGRYSNKLYKLSGVKRLLTKQDKTRNLYFYL